MMANCMLDCIKHGILSLPREVIVPLYAVLCSLSVPCAVLGTTVQKGHKTIREYPKESCKDGEDV